MPNKRPSRRELTQGLLGRRRLCGGRGSGRTFRGAASSPAAKGRAQDAQDATFRPAPSGSYPSRPPWIVGLSRGLCRGLRRTNKLPRPPCRCRGAGRPPPSRRSTLPPHAGRLAQLPRPVTTRRAPMASRRSGGGEPATLPKSFLPPHTPKTRALATPDACEGVPVPPWGGDYAPLLCAHERESRFTLAK